MSMCYLCDMCRHMRGWDQWVWKCDGIRHPLTTELKEKLAIDCGRDDPLGICKHFEPKGEWR